MVVCRLVFNLSEIATSLDKLGMILRRAQDERKILAMIVGQFGLTQWVRVRREGVESWADLRDGNNRGVTGTKAHY